MLSSTALIVLYCYVEEIFVARDEGVGKKYAIKNYYDGSGGSGGDGGGGGGGGFYQ
jgi:hypothetical protein